MPTFYRRDDDPKGVTGCLVRGLLYFAVRYSASIALRFLLLAVVAESSLSVTVLAWMLIVLLPEISLGRIENGRLLSLIGNQIHYYKIRKRVESGDLPSGLMAWYEESKISVDKQPNKALLWSTGVLTFLTSALMMTFLASFAASLYGRSFMISLVTLLPLEVIQKTIVLFLKGNNRLFLPAGKNDEFDALLKWEAIEQLKTSQTLWGEIYQSVMCYGNGLQASTPLEELERLKKLREKAKEKAQESGQTEESGGPGGV